MSITRVGIHYSASQQVIRQIHHFDRIVENGKWRVMTAEEIAATDEDQLIAHQQAKTKPGEVFVTIPHADYHVINHHQDIHSYLGLKGIAGVHDRHVILDKSGNVVAVGFFDPAIDKHHSGEIVQHADAKVGDKIINGIYTPAVSLPEA